MRQPARAGIFLTAIATAIACGAVGSGIVGSAQQPTNPDVKLVADFQDRIKAYVELHKKLEEMIPPIPDKPTPEQVEEHQRALEREIAHARAGAKPGDIFREPIRAYFRRQLARVFAGPDGKQALRSLMDENPRTVQSQVNSRYPEGVPVTNMPPTVLLVLPNLPPELEYRFLGDRLVLLDVHASIVVDYIDHAINQ
jgi:hypothetical protein